MQKSFFNKILVVAVLMGNTLMFSCKTATPVSSGSATQSTAFQDDLSAFRPSFKVAIDEKNSQEKVVHQEIAYPEPKYHSNDNLTAYLDTLASNNKKVRFIDGYTILVYSGTNRDMAMQAKNDASKIATKHRPDIQFKQPTYKVKVGRFADRLEAQKIYAQLRTQFENAIIIPEKVAIQ